MTDNTFDHTQTLIFANVMEDGIKVDSVISITVITVYCPENL
jgi:hypothetical protein